MNAYDASNPMRCANPIDAAVLADYWLGILPGDEEEAAELHLLSCDSCGARLREVMALAQDVRNLAREGSLLMIVSDAFLKRLTQEGLRVREYAPQPGGSIACTVTAEDDFLVGRMTADLSRAKRVDLYICDERRTERLRLADIPFNSSAGSVTFQQPITYAKAAPSETMVARLVAFDDAGSERLLGEYTFNHTRTLPGPGAW
jgi:hypothetical protein